MNMTQQMRDFQGRKKHPGIQDKLGWFYNQYVARIKAKRSGDPSYQGIRRKLGRKFPGYCTLNNFRNKISHGYITPSIANPMDARKLRQQAKDIVDELFIITMKYGYDIPRIITYPDAIGKINEAPNISPRLIHLTSCSLKI